jgi:hypothetical protein
LAGLVVDQGDFRSSTQQSQISGLILVSFCLHVCTFSVRLSSSISLSVAVCSKSTESDERWCVQRVEDIVAVDA